MKYGDRLRNGAKVVEYHASIAGAVVFAETDDAFTPYVTWRIGPDGSTFWGNYFGPLDGEKARNDFLVRAGLKPQKLNSSVVQ